MAVHHQFQNPSLTKGIKVTVHDAVRDEKTGKVIPGKWKKGAVKFVSPRGRGEPGSDVVDIWLDSAGRGVFLEELPT